MFRSLVVTLLVATASALTLCAADNPPNVRVVEEIAAKVNGDIITRGELERRRLEIEAAARKQGLSGDRLKQTVDEYTASSLMEQIDQLLLVQEAKDLNINVENEITRRLAEIQLQQKINDPD